MSNEAPDTVGGDGQASAETLTKPSRRWRWIVGILFILLILGAGVTATVLTLSANQAEQQAQTLTAIAQAGQATNTAQMAQAQASQTERAGQATSTAHYFATEAANQTLTKQASYEAQTAAAHARETGQAEDAAATQSVLDTYTASIERAQASPPIYGPASGTLVRNPSPYLVPQFTGVRVTNFVIDVTFENPYSISVGPFDFGILFRYIAPNEELRLSINSDGYWEITNVTGGEFNDLTGGLASVLNRGDRAINRVRLLVEDDWGVYYLNGEFIDHFDLGGWPHPGNIIVATQVYDFDGFFEPGTMDYTNLTIWRLP